MPATSLAQLYAFEDQFMSTASAVLAAAGFATPYSRGAETPIADTATLVRFTTGAATGEMVRIPRGDAAGRPAYGRFTGTLEVVRYRPRREGQSLTALVGVQRELGLDAGKIRALFGRAVLPFTEENLQFLFVTDIQPAPSSWGFDEDHQLDLVNLQWQVTFEIRTTAWPA